MEHVLATIESKVAPAAVAAGAPEGLKTGHINYGKELYDLFRDDKATTTKIEAIQRMSDALTCKQFREEAAKAQECASAEDAACGFVAAAGATGAEKYGPQRKVINTRMSEAKILFGVFKRKPELLKEKGYGIALVTAREWLSSNGLKWDGQAKATKEEREVKKANQAAKEFADLAEKILPIKPGESIRDWKLRCADKADQLQTDQKIADCLEVLESFGVEVAMQACFRFIEQQGDAEMDNCAQQLHEQAALMRERQAAATDFNP